MSLALVYSRAQIGIEAPLVTVEVHLTTGLPQLSIVGLPETAVKESKDRVRSAILNNHFEFPLKRITINLAPADLPKQSGRYDLAIAVGILAASDQIDASCLEEYEFLGELALSGEIRPIKGCLASANAIKSSQRSLILPMDNIQEASLVKKLDLYGAEHLTKVCAHLSKTEPLIKHQISSLTHKEKPFKDLSDVKAQYHAKRALEIAAAGGHSMLMAGPPGTGKTMIAERLISILPKLSETQALETATIASISQSGFDTENWLHPPFRAPHHTASAVALVGGGNIPKPGEISLAHNGVLFLDEFPEFSRQVLEVLREPLESGKICISRAANQATFPAQFQLIAAMNPCPCGYLGEPGDRCQCTEDKILKYRSRISGPLLDRIDIHVEVPNVTDKILQTDLSEKSESSSTVKKRVIAAREKQYQRCNSLNAKLTSRNIEQYCKLDINDQELLQQAIIKLNLSTRSLHRILKVSRTIADLNQAETIKTAHLSEALSFRGVVSKV